MCNSQYVHDIMNSSDIVCLQEHFLYPDYTEYLLTLHPDYNGFVRSESTLNVFDFPRRRKGGIAVLWREAINYAVEPISDLGNDIIMVIKLVTINCQPVYIVNVYMPSANYSVEYYKHIAD